jgi:transposase
MNNTLGKVREEEARLFPELFAWQPLCLPEESRNLTEKQDETLTNLSHYCLKTGKAYLIKLAFQDAFFATTRHDTEALLFGLVQLGDPLPDRTGKKRQQHCQRSLERDSVWFDSKLSNGFLEAVNGPIPAAMGRARGYSSSKNLVNIAYFITGKLGFRLPT